MNERERERLRVDCRRFERSKHKKLIERFLIGQFYFVVYCPIKKRSVELFVCLSVY